MPKIRYKTSSLVLVVTLFSCVFAIFAWVTRPLPPIPVSPDTKTPEPVIVIFRHAGAMNIPSADFDDYVEFAICSNGNIAWRETADDPNSRLLTANVQPNEVEKIFDKLSRSRLLADDLNWQFVGPDCDYVSIEIRTKTTHMKIASFHEEYGYNQSYDSEYLSLFENWSVIRESCRDLIPNNGSPYNGVEPKPTRGIPQKSAG